MAHPNPIAIASTLAGSCISHISEVSESRRKRKDDNYRIALHREFGRFRLWFHGFREPVTGQTGDRRSPNNALDEVLEEATYLKEPTILLLSTFTSCLLSGHLKKVGNDLTHASLKVALHQTIKIYPHMETAWERQWNTRESVITDISDTIDLLFDLAPPLDDVLENIRYPLVPSNGPTDLQGEVPISSSEVIEEDLPEWIIPLADAYCQIYQKYIQDKFPNASPDLDIDRFAKGNAKCHDKLLAEPEMSMPSESDINIVAPASREGLDQSLQIGQPAEVQIAATFYDSGLGSSAPTQSIISPSMGESPGGKMPAATILQDSGLGDSVSPLVNTASAQKDFKGGTFLAPPPSISGLSQSTLCSQSSTPDKRPSLPAIPEHPPYYCKLCRSNLKQMPKRSRGHQWRKHIFSDLEAYMCIRANCSQRDVFFKSKREWVAHDMTCNQVLPQESERTQTPADSQCPFCVKEFGANKAEFYNHVAHHMEDIRLFALPPSYRDLTDDFQNSSNTGATSSGTHVDRDRLPTIAETGDSQPYDQSSFERYLKANAKADKSFVGDWVLGGSPSHAEGQTVLASAGTARGAKEVLDRMPPALSETYPQILEGIQLQDPHSRRVAMIILKWLLCAQKACTTECVIEALAIDPGVPDLNNEGLKREIPDILGICNHLVVHDEELGIFRLAHPSVQEFLVQEPEFERESSNTYVAEVCVTALLYHHGDGSPVPELYSYAMEYWGDHVRLSGVTTRALTTLCMGFFKSSVAYNQWGTEITKKIDTLKPGLREHTPVVGPLLVVSYYGLPDLCRLITEDSLDQLHSRNSAGKTPLSTAADKGHDLVVHVLLECGSDVSSKDNAGKTPLSWAAMNGHDRVVRLLLEREDVYVNSNDSSQLSPLSWAALNGHDRVVKLLLEREDVDVSSKDSLQLSPLSWAAENGYENVAVLLLEREDVDVNSRDSIYEQSPLSWAAGKGHDKVVQLLLEREDVDVNSKDSIYGQNPLSWAAEKGHDNVVKLLLEREDVDVNLKDSMYGQSPLSWAAERGYDKVVQLLLERKGVDADSKSNNGRTPLSWAAVRGHDKVVKLLLERENVDVNSNDIPQRSPLSWAAENGHDKVVKLLLEREDVDVNSKDSMVGMSPLSWAAENGHDKVVQLLLEREDVDANSQDQRGRTALDMAAESGHTKVVKLLRAKS